jgi:hypothetical protein
VISSPKLTEPAQHPGRSADHSGRSIRTLDAVDERESIVLLLHPDDVRDMLMPESPDR